MGMKPVVKKELELAITRFEMLHHHKILEEQLNVLLENFLQPTNELNKIALPIGDKLEFVPSPILEQSAIVHSRKVHYSFTRKS